MIFGQIHILEFLRVWIANNSLAMTVKEDRGNIEIKDKCKLSKYTPWKSDLGAL